MGAGHPRALTVCMRVPSDLCHKGVGHGAPVGRFHENPYRANLFNNPWRDSPSVSAARLRLP